MCVFTVFVFSSNNPGIYSLKYFFNNCIISSSTIVTSSNKFLSQFLQVNITFILTGCCEDLPVCSRYDEFLSKEMLKC